MKKIRLILLTIFLSLACSIPAHATVINLYDWAFNVDGTTYEYSEGDTMPTTGALTDGLGTLTWTTSDFGPHSFIAFFDHEIDEYINTYFNEYGATTNTAAAGQSWEIDDPWYGDIYYNVLYDTLDGNNAVPFPPQDYDGDGLIDDYDVSMAMGWDFTLDTDEVATISLFLSGIAPTSGFYLSQTDPDSVASIYFSSTLGITGGTVPIPEPATLLLLGTGLVGICAVQRKKLLKK